MKIVLIPGDGVGDEIAQEVKKLLSSIESACQSCEPSHPDSIIKFDIQLVDISEDHFRETGLLIPAGLEKMCAGANFIWLGPITGKSSLQDYYEVRVLECVCERLGLNIQSRHLAPMSSLQKFNTDEPINFLVIQDQFCGRMVSGELPAHFMAEEKIDVQTTYYSHARIKSLFSVAERLIESGDHHQVLLTLPDELLGNDGPWMKFLKDLADKDIAVQVMPVERFFFQVLHNPQKLDLVLTLPPFGQVLSRLGAALEGGLGVGFDIYQDSEGKRTLFHILHPASRRFVGKDAANPVGAFLSLAEMMHLIGQPKIGVVIRQIVNESVQAGWTTRDLGGSMGTAEIGDYVCSKLSEKLAPGRLNL